MSDQPGAGDTFTDDDVIVLRRLSDAGYYLLGTIDALRVEFERAFKTPLPIFGLSDFELALARATAVLHPVEASDD